MNRARERATELRDAGASFNAIAFTLTIEGYPTMRGGPWNISSVQRLIRNPPLPEASVSYGARHRRVETARGKARGYPCARCGKQAQVWATLHDTDGLSPEGYEPMCQACNLAYDGVTGSPRSAETRAKMSAYASNRTAEHQANLNQARTGAKRTGQALENIRLGQQRRRERERAERDRGTRLDP